MTTYLHCLKFSNMLFRKIENRTWVRICCINFSKNNFDKAIRITGINKKRWLIIDEIGPLELRGGGFHTVLKEALQEQQQDILIVVRDKDNMPEQVINHFGIVNPLFITAGKLAGNELK